MNQNYGKRSMVIQEYKIASTVIPIDNNIHNLLEDVDFIQIDFSDSVNCLKYGFDYGLHQLEQQLDLIKSFSHTKISLKLDSSVLNIGNIIDRNSSTVADEVYKAVKFFKDWELQPIISLSGISDLNDAISWNILLSEIEILCGLAEFEIKVMIPIETVFCLFELDLIVSELKSRIISVQSNYNTNYLISYMKFANKEKNIDHVLPEKKYLLKTSQFQNSFVYQVMNICLKHNVKTHHLISEYGKPCEKGLNVDAPILEKIDKDYKLSDVNIPGAAISVKALDEYLLTAFNSIIHFRNKTEKISDSKFTIEIIRHWLSLGAYTERGSKITEKLVISKIKKISSKLRGIDCKLFIDKIMYVDQDYKQKDYEFEHLESKL
ncbi:hypothetical protein B5S28_g4699 [[Candida] boidinii]|uniref:Unnamed protein product n=1 Tax=Candida boidinii TaxID=5477 RepID=A0ACB5TN89_CANBO|nr:hypothetical protein B5S28_g4699 [[Candida] boidinii]OWB64342.1 hypothetical protein B5S29_g5417 [[Candida] boidinii]GME90669.1 unnamed protein product [[Candida] boidinii]